jgi:hypothetical protein
VFALLIIAFLVNLTFAMDPCDHHGELRRRYGCVAVRHTMADMCCWLKQDGSHGKLPYSCCGAGWRSANCEGLIDQLCETHHEEYVSM